MVPSPQASRIGVLLKNEQGPGGYLVSIQAHAVMTERAGEAERHLEGLVRKSLEDQGLSDYEIMIRSILGSKDASGIEAELASHRNDPESYRPMMPGDRIDDIVINAIDISGPPEDMEPDDVSLLKHVEHIDVRKDYTRSKIFRMGVGSDSLNEDMLSPASSSYISLGAETALTVLSGLLHANGYGAEIARAADAISKQSWISFGEERDAIVSEAAHTAVLSAGGLFTTAVLDRVVEFTHAMAAHDMRLHAEEYLPLADGLIDNGHTDKASAFDANDLRDWGHAVREGGWVRLFDRTQNGTYRLDLLLAYGDEGEHISRAEAFAINNEPARPICRFEVCEDGAWVPDYGSDIPYSARNTKDVNNMISSLASLSCVLEEELKQRADDSGPGF